jgi:polyphenol oxidase
MNAADERPEQLDREAHAGEGGKLRWLRPQWQVPARVCAAFSLRHGGVSSGAYASLNLGSHVGDDPRAVVENRRRLRAALSLPAEPLWLAQQHGAMVVDADRVAPADGVIAANSVGAEQAAPQADAAITRSAGRVLAVLVADCLPVLLARADGSAVAIAHAGWRGLAAGVLEAAVAAFQSDPASLHAWLGPAIGPDHFEVGSEVLEALCVGRAQTAVAFQSNARGRWQCDLYELARQRLVGSGVHHVTMAQRCSYEDPDAFFSFRRDRITGRMAALVWLQG